MPEMRQLVINSMAFTDVSAPIGPLIAPEQPIICVEGVQNLVIFILRITLTKHLEDLAVKRQSV